MSNKKMHYKQMSLKQFGECFAHLVARGGRGVWVERLIACMCPGSNPADPVWGFQEISLFLPSQYD